ncbi:MAG: hypothetical protein ACTHK3_02725, partial [Solirubrobacterales bacterium]
MASWVIFACRTPYALEVAETIWRRGEEVAALVDNLPPGEGAAEGGDQETIGAPVLTPAELLPEHFDLPVAIPLITPGHRFAVAAEARALGFRSFPAL